MKRLIPALITICVALLAACQIDDEMYTAYDVYYDNAFTTDSTNAVLKCAAKEDSLDKNWDVWIRVKGNFQYVSSNIVEYGHCWTKGNALPVLNKDGSNYIASQGTPTVNEPFYTTITDLECETEYTVRSYVKTSDGHIGYNPKPLVIVTDHPHDKWFETQGFLGKSIIANRSDCVNIITTVEDDTLTFFGMGRSGAKSYDDMWCYSSKTKTYEQIPPIKSHSGEIMSLWGAVGFGINYRDSKLTHHLLYVGCGCKKTDGTLNINDYNKKFFVYDIDTRIWSEVMHMGENNEVELKEPFIGQPRTGGIGFSIGGEWGFVGLGEFRHGTTTSYHSDIYLFMMASDEKKQYSPTSGYFIQMAEDFGFGGRSGASVAVVDDIAYIIGGTGNPPKSNEVVYFDDFIPCRFIKPINSDPNSNNFSWPERDKLKHIKTTLPDFKSRAYATSFAVDGSLFYGMGEGKGDNGKIEHYSDMIKYDLKTNYIPKICAPYMNEDSPASRVSRAMVIHGGDRAFVVGGATGDDDVTSYNDLEWVYRP